MDDQTLTPPQGADAVLPPKPPLFDLNLVRQALKTLVRRGDVVELRILEGALKADRGRWRGTLSGYFDNGRALCAALLGVEAVEKGTFLTLNPVRPELLARRANVLASAGKAPTTTDVEVAARRWFLVDLDAVRPSGISATDEEKAAAMARAAVIREWLVGNERWPEPVQADSGNGAHLLWRVDLPNDDASTALVQRCLAALGARFDAQDVHVDRTVFNAARIVKLYGAATVKGSHTARRPHRMSRVLIVPESGGDVVTQEQLETLAAMAPAEPSKAAARVAPKWGKARAGTAGGEPFDVESWLRKNVIGVKEPRVWHGSGRKWVLDACPFDPGHTDNSAFVAEMPSGAIAAGCHHDSCRGKWGWRELRERVDPGCYDKQPARRREAQADATDAARATLEALLELAREGDAKRVITDALTDDGIVDDLAHVFRNDARAWGAAVNRFRAAGARALDVRDLERTVKAAARAAAGLRLVEEHFELGGGEPEETAPPDETNKKPDYVIPHGWGLRAGRLFKLSYDENGNVTGSTHVASAPPIPVACYRDVETDQRQLECEFAERGGRCSILAPRGAWMAAAALLKLADRGLPVHQNNARMLTEWVSDFELANPDILPFKNSVSHFGWYKRNFVLGNEVLGEDDSVRFVPVNVGEDEMARALVSGGTAEEWERVVLPLAVKYPVVLVALVAAHATALMGPLGAPSFVVEFSDESSSGKTTASRLGMSVWGRPDFDDSQGQSGAALAQTFNTTFVAAERYLAVTGHGIPAFFDDSQLAPKDSLPGDLVMMVGNGVGKGRGAKEGGRQDVAKWNTIAIVTGEKSIEETSPFAGISGRMLPFYGSPFGGRQPDDVEALTRAIVRNYGHSGRKLVRALQERPALVAQAKADYLRWQDVLATQLPKDSITQRRRKYLALLLTTAEALDAVLPWQACCGDFNVLAWDVLHKFLVRWASGMERRDQTAESYNSFVSWCTARRTSFWDTSNTQDVPDPRDRVLYAGAWDERNKVVLALSTAMEDWSRTSGYPVKTSVRLWERRGLVACDEPQPGQPRRFRRRILLFGVPMTVVPVRIVDDPSLEGEAERRALAALAYGAAAKVDGRTSRHRVAEGAGAAGTGAGSGTVGAQAGWRDAFDEYWNENTDF